MFFKRIQKEQSDLSRSEGLQAFLSFLTHPSAGSSHRPQCCMGPQLLLCSPEAQEKLQGCSPESLRVSSSPAPTAAPTSSSWTQGPMRNVVVMSLDGTDELTGLCLHPSHSPGATHTAGEETDKASQIPLEQLFGLIPIDLRAPRLAVCLSGCSKAFLALRPVTVRKAHTNGVTAFHWKRTVSCLCSAHIWSIFWQELHLYYSFTTHSQYSCKGVSCSLK